MALGPQIYVDGLGVLDGRKVAGIIGGRHAIEYILYHQKDWLQGTASRMSQPVSALDAGRPLNDALDIFSRIGFAFVPITIDQNVVITLSARDVLKIAIDSKLKTPAGQLSSKVIAIDNNTSIGSALELMREQGVRGLIVRDNHRKTAPNDRKMLEYLLSYTGRLSIFSKGLEGLFETAVSVFNLVEAGQARMETPARVAAGHLLDVNIPCRILGNDPVVTPWDIVMKGLGKRPS